MLLRASGERDEVEYDLGAVTDSDRDCGVPNSNWLRALTEQAIRGGWQALQGTRAEASGVMGEQQVVDALVVASAFNGITRVADATGIPLDANTAETTVDMRAAVGLDAFDYGEKAARFG
jgi:alkylhydroperoxidase family enzyme